jgi:hypothetical protein
MLNLTGELVPLNVSIIKKEAVDKKHAIIKHEKSETQEKTQCDKMKLDKSSAI